MIKFLIKALFPSKSEKVLIPSSDPNIKFLVKSFTSTNLGKTSFSGENIIGRNVVLIGKIDLGYATTINDQCWFRGPIEIGRYVQFGPKVSIYATNHNMRLLTPYNNSQLLNGEMKKFIIKEKVRIGHGSWIGCGAIILKGVTVGRGAVIGAGSVVTKDVPNYGIAIGNPAKTIRYRFDQETISIIEGTTWWKKNLDELSDVRDILQMDIVKDKDKFKNQANKVFR